MDFDTASLRKYARLRFVTVKFGSPCSSSSFATSSSILMMVLVGLRRFTVFPPTGSVRALRGTVSSTFSILRMRMAIRLRRILPFVCSTLRTAVLLLLSSLRGSSSVSFDHVNHYSGFAGFVKPFRNFFLCVMALTFLSGCATIESSRLGLCLDMEVHTNETQEDE